MSRAPIPRVEAEQLFNDLKAAAGIPEGMDVTLKQQRLVGGVQKSGRRNPVAGDRIDGIPYSEGGLYRYNFLSGEKTVATLESKFSDGAPVLWTYQEVQTLKK